MIDNIFDNKVRDILRNIKMNYKSDSWSRLETKLNNIDQEDAAFDSIIAGKLKTHSVIASGNAFNKFEKKTSVPKNKKYIYIIVGIAAVLLLLIFTVFNIDSEQIEHLNSPSLTNTIIEKNKIDNKNEAQIDVSKTLTSGQNSTITKSNFEIEIVNSNKVETNNLGIEKNLSIKPKMEVSYLDYLAVENEDLVKSNFGVAMSFNYFQKKKSYISNFSSKYFNSTNDIIDNNLYAKNLNIPTKLVDFYSPLIINHKKILFDSKNENVIPTSEKINENIEELASANNQIADFEKDNPNVGIDPNLSNSQITNGFSINANLSPNINLVDTPNDLILNVPGYNQSAFGINLGLSVSLKKFKNEIESGLEYHILNYTPRKIQSKVDDSKSYYLESIKYNIVKVPLNYKYHFIENKDWDIYSISGVSANIIANSDYRFVEQTNIGGIDFNLQKYANELQNDNNFQQSLYSQKNYDVGAFEGGKINKNIYFAVNAGIGIKRKLQKGFSLFFEPQFNYNFNSFGPNDDNISNLNMKFGVNKLIDL